MKRIQKIGRMVFFLLSVLFVLCVLVQFWFAGMAVFVQPGHWRSHVLFVHIFGFSLPLLMLLFAWIGSVPGRFYRDLIIIFILVYGMYFTANGSRLLDWMGALHLLTGLLLAAWSGGIAYRAAWLIFLSSRDKDHTP